MVPASALACAWVATLSLASAAMIWPEVALPEVTRLGRKLLNIEFQELSVPRDLERHQVRLSASAYVDGTKVATQYNTLQRSGDEHGGVFGKQLDIQGSPLVDADGAPMISNSADFSSLISFEDSVVYSISHFEAVPAAAYLSKLDQDKDGKLTVVSTMSMDFSKYNGLWNPCAGSVTPWKTHLGSEEYEPDARAFMEASLLDLLGDGTDANAGDSDVKGMLQYMRVPNVLSNPSAVSEADVRANFLPYMYGYAWEAVIDPMTGTASATKHFSMGRLAHELAYVMPDGKTVYLTDDGDNKMMCKYICNKAGDLTAGTLYAAKFTQQMSDMPGGKFTLEWISLGEADDASVEKMARSVKFSDLFETADASEDGSCPAGYKSTNAGDYGIECLKVKPGMEMAASRFETRRYAAYMGATTEFSKMEGITFDEGRMRLYMSLSEIRTGMEDNMKKGEADTSHDIGGNNDIKLPYNPCGCVYYLDVDADYSAHTMTALECGSVNPDYIKLDSDAAVTHAQDLDPNYHNFCVLDGLANPDNLAYIPGHDGLVIGEDTVGGHQNDVMWYYDFRTSTKTRFLSTPYGSETTSPYWYPNINGHSYLIAVVQHPYGESDEEKLSEPQNTGISNWVGYVGPFAPPQCAKRWGQCDGKPGYFHGPYCCSGTDMCVKVNEWYSGCQPGPTPPGKVAWWGQCGGMMYSGLTDCEDGSECKMQNPYYSQCLPIA